MHEHPHTYMNIYTDRQNKKIRKKEKQVRSGRKKNLKTEFWNN